MIFDFLFTFTVIVLTVGGVLYGTVPESVKAARRERRALASMGRIDVWGRL